MTSSRDRIRQTLRHQAPDRVAVDFGSTAVTGMHVTAVAALRQHYGLEPRPVRVCEPYQMLGAIEDDLLEALGIDTVALPAASTIFGFRNERWKPFRAPWGQALLVSEHFNTRVDANGDLLIFPGGDATVPPSGRYLPLQDDIASVAFWYQSLPTAPFPALPDRNDLEII